MKKCTLFVFLIISISLKCFSQDQDKKLELKILVGFALLGEGDYEGFYYGNSIEYPIIKHIYLSGNFGCLVSSNTGIQDVLLGHNIFLLQGDLCLIIRPIDLKRLYLNFGLGGSLRHRSEIVVDGISIMNGVTSIKYKSEESIDIGYLWQLGVGYRITHRISLELDLGMHSFNKGTGLLITGLGAKIKI